jgi:hypothetical protein
MKMGHLTDEQFAELLAGAKSDAWAQVHLENCADCRDELHGVGSAVGDLSVASLRWAERRALRIERPSEWRLNWNALPGWGATMAGFLVLGVALGAHIENREQAAVVRQPAHAVAAPSEDELAQDNRLLRSINSELTEQVGAQVATAQPASDSRTDRRHSLREVAN